jgi:hypothetical protein
MAYDEAIERYELGIAEVYDQLSRCLVGFLVGLFHELPVEMGHLNADIGKVLRLVRCHLCDDPVLQVEVVQYFEQGRFLQEILSVDANLSLDTLLYRTSDPEFDRMLNVTIAASLELGRTVRRIYDLARCEIDTHLDMRWYMDFVFVSLIRMGNAQANTVVQKRVEEITWKRYVRIAYHKSCTLFDFYAGVCSVLDRDHLIRARFHALRFCEQFYLDDFPDFDADTRSGVLNLFGVFLVEQGRLAKKVSNLLEKLSWDSPELIPQLKDALATIPILQTYFEETFLVQNPIIQARRDGNDEIAFEADNLEQILREAFVNTRDELALPLVELLWRRIATGDAFEHYWQRGQYRNCARLVNRSSIAIRLIEGFLAFLDANKHSYLEANPYFGRLYYYFTVAEAKYQRLRYLAKREAELRLSGMVP